MSITLTQQKYLTSNYTSTRTVTLGVAPASGATLKMCFSGADVVSSVTGGGVTTWTKLINKGASNAAEIWAGVVDTTPSATVTVTTSASNRANINVSEWSGMAATLTGDGTNSATGGNTTVNPGSITPTAGAAVLILAAARSNAGTLPSGVPTGGFTELDTDGTGDNLHAFAYLIVASASGSYSCTWPAPGNNYAAWNAVIAGLDGASGGAAARRPRRCLVGVGR